MIHAEERSLEPGHLNAFLDVDLDVAVELGHVEIAVRGLLELKVGSVIPFPSRLEEPLQMLVNGLPFGRCDLVPGDGPIHVRVVELTHGSTGGRSA